jgi:tripartite-type tricarboxylate transporter receptor subunit TctC
LFKSTAGGLNIAHVPYKGSAPAMAALLGGEIEIMFDNLGVTLQHVKGGRLRALAVGSEKRVASLPEVPTMSEILSGFSSVAWFGIVAPPKTPAPIAEKLSAAVAEAIRQPDVAGRLAAMSAEPIGGTPAEMAAFMRRDEERWKSVIESAQVKAD